MKKTLLSLSLLTAGIFCNSLANATVVTTVKPLQFIINDIANGVTDTQALVTGNQSPHTFSLSPAQVKQIKEADLLVYIDSNMEMSLGKLLENPRNAPNRILKLTSLKDIREELKYGEHNHHDHDDHDGHDHNHGELSADYHIWMDPDMAEDIAEEVAYQLKQIYPSKANLIESNLRRFKNELDRTENQIERRFDDARLKNYYVYHDAYQYFEEHFDFRKYNRGSINTNLNIEPSLKTISDLNVRAKADNVTAIMVEPQFNNSVALRLGKAINASIHEIDPLGSKIPVAQGAYSRFLLDISNSFYKLRR